jgi:hypothetical protein
MPCSDPLTEPFDLTIATTNVQGLAEERASTCVGQAVRT